LRVIEKTLDRLQEKRAKVTALGIRSAQQTPLQHFDKKFLRKIFGVLLRMDAAGDKGEDRTPITPAELSQCFGGFLVSGLGVDRGENHAPAGGVETAMCLWHICALAGAHLDRCSSIDLRKARK